MKIILTLLSGVKFGIEYADLDDVDKELFETEASMAVVVDVLCFRVLILCGR